MSPRSCLTISAVRRMQRRYKFRELLRIEMAVGPNAAAQIDTEGHHSRDSVGHVAAVDPSGEEHGYIRPFNNLSAQAPVVHPTGAAKLTDRGCRVARIQEQRIDVPSSEQCGVDRVAITNVNDLNDSGLAVGYYRRENLDFYENAVVWRDGEFIELSDPTAESGKAVAVNNSNVIVGIVDFGLVRWDPVGDGWAMTRLGVTNERPSDVNDLGDIVGTLGEPPPSDSEEWRWRSWL